MIKVCILGVGKVGTHLIKACIDNIDIKLTQIYSRSYKSLKEYIGIIPVTQNINELEIADLYVVALPDDVISQLDLNYLTGLVVHTSGTVSYSALKAKQTGVFYPLQSFTKEKSIDLKETPFCLETKFAEDYGFLVSFTKLISNVYDEMNEQKRQKLHLAAVFANNFTNRVMGIVFDVCKEQDIDFNMLQPLIQETFLKTKTLNPDIAQTGPAIRNDKGTIKKHLKQLTGTNKEVYKILTKSIQEKHGIEL